jgi:hypothetical protein
MYKPRWHAHAFLVSLLAILTAHSAPLGIMVPAYFYPSANGYWKDLDAAATHVPLIVIMNPASGPGQSRDKSYVRALSKLHHAGGKVIGYVHTAYGDRPLPEVENEIDRYLSFYALDGFFVDEMTNDENKDHLDYYASLYQYIKSKGANYTVTGNPGCNTTEDYITRPTDDSLMIFEDNSTNYVNFTPSQWVVRYSARHFVHLPYNVTTGTTMTNYVKLAVSRHAGWICITDDTLPNPYKALPSYWTNEVNLVQSFNRDELPGALQQTAKR